MQYAILVYETAADFAARTDPARQAEYWGAYTKYAQALAQAGVAAGGNALQPPTTGTTLRIRGDRHDVQDGPFADTKEQLGGMFVIEAPDLDTAMQWAARCPAASWGAVEVRPILPMNG